MKILIFLPHNPFLRLNGIQSRFYNLLCYFKNRKYTVDVLSLKNYVDTWEKCDYSLIRYLYLSDFKKIYNIKKAFKYGYRKAINFGKNFFIDLTYKDLQNKFSDITEKNDYDFVIISHVNWADLIKKNKNKNTKTIITIEDFISINGYEWNNGNYNLGWSLNEEIKKINLFDKAICISNDEMSFFEKLCKKVEFEHIPHFLDPNFNNDRKKKYDITFIGSDNPFNKRGIIWFFNEIMPFLDDNLNIQIIGEVNKYLSYYKEKYKNITFLNHVDKLDNIYKDSKITICPLLGGTGLKIKVVESLSYGVPVVTTKYGVIGFPDNAKGCIITNDPLEFAQGINYLLNDDLIYNYYVKEAEKYFLENFSTKSVYKKLDKIFTM